MPGWTDLSVTGDGIVYYVSSSGGSDSNDGLSTGAPFATLAHAYAALRDGHPDQVLLKCGDTWNTAFPAWNKSAESSTAYMVVGTYGATPSDPRAKVRCSGTAFDAGGGGHAGLAIYGIDFECPDQSTGDSGVLFFAPWSNVLIENCRIANFPVNIVVQEVDANRSTKIKIRRNVIVDSFTSGTGHSQGIFMGSCDDWLVEENVLDRNARNKADLFCHNVYIHETNGSGVFRRNISARACSHGVQQRPGGEMFNNLYLHNAINAYIGTSDSGTTADENYIGYNVALDSKDINGTDRRGYGFHLDGGGVSMLCEYNVAAHQESGTDAVEAFELHAKEAHVHHNVAYNWESPNNEGWATCYQWESGGGTGAETVVFEDNVGVQLLHGMCVRHEGRVLSGAFTYQNNRYYTQNPFGGYAQFSWNPSGGNGSYAAWVSQAGESGSSFAAMPGIDARITDYMASLGLTETLDAFMTAARGLSEQDWDTRFLAYAVNDWVRDQFGLPQVGDGSGSQTVTCGQAAETDAAFAVAVLFHHIVAAGQAAETDSASAVAAVVNGQFPVGQAVETDAAPAVSGLKLLAVVQTAEADVGLAVTFTGGAIVVLSAAGTMNRDTAMWDRRPDGPPDLDADMNPVLGKHAPGYPFYVVGRFQETARDAERTDAGEAVGYDASFYTAAFLTGRVGDLVTLGGRTYTVDRAMRRREVLSPVIRFVRYDLRVVELGADQTGGAD